MADHGGTNMHSDTMPVASKTVQDERRMANIWKADGKAMCVVQKWLTAKQDATSRFCEMGDTLHLEVRGPSQRTISPPHNGGRALETPGHARHGIG